MNAPSRTVRLGQLLDQARQRRADGDYTAAQSLLDRARTLVSRESPCDSVDLAIEQGVLNQSTGQHRNAEHAYRRALEHSAHCGDAIGDVHRRLAAHHGLGSTLRMQGNYEAAETRLREALAFADTRLAPGAPETVPILNELGVTSKYCGKFAQGEQYYRRALTILQAAHGKDHPTIATIYHNLGGLAHARGDYAAAEPLARKAVEIRERHHDPSHPAVAADKAALAPILDALGKQDEAENLLQQVLTTYIDHEDRYEIGVTLHNLGSIAYRRGQIDAAEQHLARALDLKEDLLGPDHPELAATLNNLGLVRHTRGDLANARAMYQRAITILERTVDPTHPTLKRCRAKLRATDPADRGASQTGG
jgi:tetratricopeptide (TPR) repeat protein